MSDYTTIYLHVDTEPVPNELIFTLVPSMTLHPAELVARLS